MVAVEPERVNPVFVYVFVPSLPKLNVPEIFYFVALHDAHFCRRFVGMRGKYRCNLASHTLRKECHRLSVKRRYKVPLLYGLQVFRYSTGDLDIAGAKGHTTQGRVENVVLTLKKGNPWVLTAVFLPLCLRDYELP